MIRPDATMRSCGSVNRSKPSRWPAAEKGATMIEVAISLPIFLLILGAGLEMLRFAFYVVTIQLIAASGARAASLGACGHEMCTPQLRASFVIDHVVSAGRMIGISLPRSRICIRAQSDLDCSHGENTTGRSKELIVIRVEYPMRYLFGIGALTVRSAAVARNEPRNDV